MALVYLGLGSNLGDKNNNILLAIDNIISKIGAIVAQSSFITTSAWGFNSENDFLNAVVLIQTDVQPFELLEFTQEIEKNLGRKNKTDNAYTDRLIDIDILFYDDLILNHPKLTIPHPLIHKRLFVLEPLAEITPNFIHPQLQLTVDELKRLLSK